MVASYIVMVYLIKYSILKYSTCPRKTSINKFNHISASYINHILTLDFTKNNYDRYKGMISATDVLAMMSNRMHRRLD